jgi:hypothetical protein
MYGLITTFPAPVEMYDGMHAEMLRRVGMSFDGLLGAHWASDDRRLPDAGGLGVKGAQRPRQPRHRLSPDAGTGWRSASTLDGAGNGNLRRTRPCEIPSGNIVI